DVSKPFFLRRITRTHVLLAIGVVAISAMLGWFNADRSGDHTLLAQNTVVTSVPQDQISDEEAKANELPIGESPVVQTPTPIPDPTADVPTADVPAAEAP